jgi:hypothetical protein
VPLPFPTRGLQQLDDQPADSWPPATPGPNDTPDPGWFLGPSAQPSPDDDQGYGYARPSCGPDPAWQAPEPLPFKAAGGEYPENVETLALRLAITPKGDSDLAMELAADLDEPVSVPNSAMRLPGHWKFLARVPGVTLSWESRLSLIPGRMTFTGSGKMIVEVEKGEEQVNYAVTLREATRTASASMTNVGAKMKLRIATDGSAPPRTQVLSIDGGREIEVGTVGMKPGSGNVALVRFNDGKTLEWELYPRDLFGQLGGSTAAFQPPARATQPAPWR